MTDWAATGQMVSGIGTVSGALAIVIGAFVGRSALKNFRHQKITERHIEQSEKALTVAYRLKDAISFIRSPAIFGHESADSREELAGKDWFLALPQDEQDRWVTSNVYYQRTRSQKDSFDAAFAILPHVRAYFGVEVFEAFRAILSEGRSIRIYADSYARDRGLNPEHTRRIESVLWEGGNYDGIDKVAEKIDASVELIEGRLLPNIQIQEQAKTGWFA